MIKQQNHIKFKDQLETIETGKLINIKENNAIFVQKNQIIQVFSNAVTTLNRLRLQQNLRHLKSSG